MFFAAPQLLKFLDFSQGIEPLNYALGTFLDNELACIAIYASFMLYLLKVPTIELIKAQQRFSLFPGLGPLSLSLYSDSARLTGSA